MEIVDANAGVLTNFEVYQALQNGCANQPVPSHQQFVTTLRKRRRKLKQLADQQKEHVARLQERQQQQHQSDDDDDHDDDFSYDEAKSTMARSLELLRSLEQSVWVRDRTLYYLEHYTPAAVQDADSIAILVEQITELEGGGAGGGDGVGGSSGSGDGGVDGDDRDDQSGGSVLTLGEVASIVNMRPSSAVELALIVENCDERLTQRQQSVLLDLVSTICLPAPAPPTRTEARELIFAIINEAMLEQQRNEAQGAR